MSKLYDTVKRILETMPDTRDSDKKLIWAVMCKKQLVQARFDTPVAFAKLEYKDFLNAPSFESITRARRKVQENHPHLNATKSFIRDRRHQKAETGGNFVYHEKA